MDSTTEWTTRELQEEFEIMGFSMGLVVVKRKADRVVGSMTFHTVWDDERMNSHRVYTGWKADQ